MPRISTDPRRIEIWQAMADHFLDTETRHDIPLTAMRCVAAGCSTTEARDIWRFEVSPAVAFNVWDVAGEWAGWERNWLLERIERLRTRWDSCPGTLRWLRYRVRVHFLHGVWLSIERCMEALLRVESFAERERMARDLAFLARQYFDFCPNAGSAPDAADRARLRSRYPEPFRRIMAPALVPGEAQLADGRVRRALGEQARP